MSVSGGVTGHAPASIIGFWSCCRTSAAQHKAGEAGFLMARRLTGLLGITARIKKGFPRMGFKTGSLNTHKADSPQLKPVLLYK